MHYLLMMLNAFPIMRAGQMPKTFYTIGDTHIQVPALPYSRIAALPGAPGAPAALNSSGIKTKKDLPANVPTPFAKKHSNSDLQVNCNLLFNSYLSSPPTSLPPAQQTQHDLPPKEPQSKEKGHDRTHSAAMDSYLPASVLTSVASGNGDVNTYARRSVTSVDATSDYMYAMHQSTKSKAKDKPDAYGGAGTVPSEVLSTNSGIFIDRGSNHQLDVGAVPMGGIAPTGARKTGAIRASYWSFYTRIGSYREISRAQSCKAHKASTLTRMV